jgi:hypothetical protein
MTECEEKLPHYQMVFTNKEGLLKSLSIIYFTITVYHNGQTEKERMRKVLSKLTSEFLNLSTTEDLENFNPESAFDDKTLKTTIMDEFSEKMYQNLFLLHGQRKSANSSSPYKKRPFLSIPKSADKIDKIDRVDRSERSERSDRFSEKSPISKSSNCGVKPEEEDCASAGNIGSAGFLRRKDGIPWLEEVIYDVRNNFMENSDSDEDRTLAALDIRKKFMKTQNKTRHKAKYDKKEFLEKDLSHQNLNTRSYKPIHFYNHFNSAKGILICYIL